MDPSKIPNVIRNHSELVYNAKMAAKYPPPKLNPKMATQPSVKAPPPEKEITALQYIIENKPKKSIVRDYFYDRIEFLTAQYEEI